MRGIVWLVLLFIVAVVAATTLGRNDGLVSIYFGAWRTDLSLNLFVLLVLAACAVLMAAARSINSLISLPQHAREWRQLRRERSSCWASCPPAWPGAPRRCGCACWRSA